MPLHQCQTVSDLASAAASLSATKAVLAYPTAEDLAAYGLDDPYSVARLNVAVKTTEEPEDTSSHHLLVGGIGRNQVLQRQLPTR